MYRLILHLGFAPKRFEGVVEKNIIKISHKLIIAKSK